VSRIVGSSARSSSSARSTSLPGVLPLLDADLPEKPTKDDRPWLAMPIATPIADALVGKPLETVVSALAEIAGTLLDWLSSTASVTATSNRATSTSSTASGSSGTSG